MWCTTISRHEKWKVVFNIYKNSFTRWKTFSLHEKYFIIIKNILETHKIYLPDKNLLIQVMKTKFHVLKHVFTYDTRSKQKCKKGPRLFATAKIKRNHVQAGSNGAPPGGKIVGRQARCGIQSWWVIQCHTNHTDSPSLIRSSWEQFHPHTPFQTFSVRKTTNIYIFIAKNSFFNSLSGICLLH